MNTGTMTDPRQQFAMTASDLLDQDSRSALVYAEISGQFFGDAHRRHPNRVINVGIREQLLVSVGGGLALTGMRPIVHTFASFLVERAFEQIKLDFGHQGAGGVLVSSGGSFDMVGGGRTHESPGDMALMSTLDAHLHAPSTSHEVDAIVRHAMRSDGLHYVRVVGQTNSQSFVTDASSVPLLHTVKQGTGPIVIALGPVLDDALEAATGTDATVLYTSSVRPLDAQSLRAHVHGDVADVVLVEPWTQGTSTAAVSEALNDIPHRITALGVSREELRRYGNAREHMAAHGLDTAGIRRAIDERSSVPA